METAAQSADPEIAEELLHYFVDNNERECFAASLYTCYDLIRPDVAMEVTLRLLLVSDNGRGIFELRVSGEWCKTAAIRHVSKQSHQLVAHHLDGGL